MAPLTHWNFDPVYINLLIFIFEKTENVESPMNILSLAREFKEKNGTSQTLTCLKSRIERMRTWIQSYEHIDTDTKVKVLFALSASVNADFLEELRKNALVLVDEKNRITKYESIDWNLELRRDNSKSVESKRNYRKLIRDCFENNADAVPQNNYEKEMWNLIEFITRKCGTVDSPLCIGQLTKDFNKHFGISRSARTIRTRIKVYCAEIQGIEILDTHTKVRQLFGLSATVDPEYLEKLRKDALVDVDEKNRIIRYTANDKSLELSGDHSMSAKVRTALLESKGSFRSLITNYFEKVNDSDAVPSNKEESEVWQLIEFTTEKCENVNSPLSIRQLAKDFKTRFGISVPLGTIRSRVKSYGREIQTMEFLDTLTKVQQLFSLSATLDSNYLKKIRKDAVVEVDSLNRITKYTSNDGSLKLHGDHSQSAKNESGWIVRRKNKKLVKNHCNSDGDKSEDSEKDNQYSEGDSDESEESESELHPENEDDHSNYSIDDEVKLEPFRGSIQEDFNEIKDDIQQIPKPLQAHDEHNQIEEVPIKMEYKEPVEVKPQTSHNSKIKFFEAMHSLILCLGTPSLSQIQSEIHQKIQKLRGSDELILNNEILLTIESLIARMSNDSVVNLSKNMESVNFSNFLCYLKAAILNSKMSGMEGLVKKISNLIEEWQNKRIPMEKVANVLRSTLDIDSF